MIITRNRTSRVLMLPVLACALLLAACGGGSSDKASTSPAPVTTAPKAPPKPKPAPLPAGLSTSSLDDIETSRANDPLDKLYLRNRPETTNSPVRVAMLLPQTGRAADAGDIILKAAQMAIFDSGQDRLMLMPYDTQSTPEGAQEAARRADRDGAQLVLGPLFGDHVQTVAGVMRTRAVPVLAFSNDRTAAGNGAAVLGLTPENEIRRILNYAALQGLENVGAFLPDSPFGFLVADRLRELAPSSRIQIARVTHYPAGSFSDNQQLLDAARRFADYDERQAELERERAKLRASATAAAKSALARLENRDTFGNPPFEAVLIAEPSDRLATIAPLLAFYDVDPQQVQFLGMSSWYGDGLEREPTLINAVFPGPQPEDYDTLMQRYSDRYGTYPGRLAALAYDAVAVAADLASRTGPDGRITSEMILQPEGYAAYYGPFRITRDGTTQRLLTVMRVTERGIAIADPAPARFEPLLN